MTPASRRVHLEIDVSVGRSYRPGALRGALVGAGIIALFAQAAYWQNGGGEGGHSRNVIVAVGIPVGAAVGGLTGGIHGVEKWQSVDFDSAVRSQP